MTNLDTISERDRLALLTHKPGDRVRVLPAYRMGGAFVADGCEGSYVVLAHLGGACNDYKLARFYAGIAADTADWDVIVHASRIAPIGGAA